MVHRDLIEALNRGPPGEPYIPAGGRDSRASQHTIEGRNKASVGEKMRSIFGNRKNGRDSISSTKSSFRQTPSEMTQSSSISGDSPALNGNASLDDLALQPAAQQAAFGGSVGRNFQGQPQAGARASLSKAFGASSDLEDGSRSSMPPSDEARQSDAMAFTEKQLPKRPGSAAPQEDAQQQGDQNSATPREAPAPFASGEAPSKVVPWSYASRRASANQQLQSSMQAQARELAANQIRNEDSAVPASPLSRRMSQRGSLGGQDLAAGDIPRSFAQRRQSRDGMKVTTPMSSSSMWANGQTFSEPLQSPSTPLELQKHATRETVRTLLELEARMKGCDTAEACRMLLRQMIVAEGEGAGMSAQDTRLVNPAAKQDKEAQTEGGASAVPSSTDGSPAETAIDTPKHVDHLVMANGYDAVLDQTTKSHQTIAVWLLDEGASFPTAQATFVHAGKSVASQDMVKSVSLQGSEAGGNISHDIAADTSRPVSLLQEGGGPESSHHGYATAEEGPDGVPSTNRVPRIRNLRDQMFPPGAFTYGLGSHSPSSLHWEDERRLSNVSSGANSNYKDATDLGIEEDA